MHVSPFWPMSQHYRFTLSVPGEHLLVRIENIADEGDHAGELMHVAGLSLDRHPLTQRGLMRCLVRYPVLTHRVSAGIHVHAAVLALRGARFYPHPKRRSARAAK